MYKGQVWYYAGASMEKNLIIQKYCNFPLTANKRIYARTKDVRFISFKSSIIFRKKEFKYKNPDTIKKDIFNQINSYRKKHGIAEKMV